MKKNVWLLIVFLLIVLLGIAAYYLRDRNDQSQAMPEVKVNEVSARKVQGIEAVDDLNDLVYLAEKNQYLISSFDESKLYLLNPVSFQLEGEVPVEYPHKILVSDFLNELFVSTGGGKVVRLSLDSFTKTGEIKVEKKPADMVFDHLTGYLFVINEFSNSVSVIDIGSSSVIETILVGKRPIGLTLTKNSEYIYVANERDSSVSVISVRSLRVIDTIFGIGRPTKITTFPTKALILILDRFNSELVVIDQTSNKVEKRIGVVQFPTDLAVSTSERKIYVTSFSDNRIGVVDLDTETMIEEITLGSAFESRGGLNNIELTHDETALIITNTNIGEVYMVQIN